MNQQFILTLFELDLPGALKKWERKKDPFIHDLSCRYYRRETWTKGTLVCKCLKNDYALNSTDSKYITFAKYIASVLYKYFSFGMLTFVQKFCQYISKSHH